MLFTKWITQELFNFLSDEYMLSANCKEFRRFLLYLATGTCRTYGTGNLSLHSELCAALEGKKYDSNYSSAKYLKLMKQYISFEFSDYIPKQLSREIIKNPLSESFISFVSNEIVRSLSLPKEQLVHYYSGKHYFAQHQKKQDENEMRSIAEIENNRCRNKVKLQEDVENYFNNLATNSFTKIVSKNLEAAVSQCFSFPFADEETRRYNLNLLSQIRMQPKPFYASQEGTRRLFAVGASITYLKKEIRKTLTKGWLEADLSNAHLAIIAKEWQLPELERILSEKSFWQYLADEGIDMSRKSIYKDNIYSIIYGKKPRAIKDDFYVAGLSREEVEMFFHLPIIKLILRRRNQEIDFITRSLINDPTYIPVDCFSMPCLFSYPKGWTTAGGKHIPAIADQSSARSILSQQNQAIELMLMEPMLNLKCKEFMLVCLYQFDGCSIASLKPSHVKYHIRQIENQFQEHIDKLGYKTKIKIEINQ
jgi:hypothetical protein